MAAVAEKILKTPTITTNSTQVSNGDGKYDWKKDVTVQIQMMIKVLF